MRLDKFLSQMGKASRSECARLAKAGKISVNGKAVRRCDIHINELTDEVIFCGNAVSYKRFTYIMLNKPEGYVSATDDPSEKTVLDLVPEEERRKNLFPCGRLDKNTLGLVILTNDGEGAHRVLSPKKHVPKVYYFECGDELNKNEREAIEAGVDIGGYVTKPCKIEMLDGTRGKITITEGKYHQIKRMLEAVGNNIVYLERVNFGIIELDPQLGRGEWRYLTPDEEEIFK